MDPVEAPRLIDLLINLIHFFFILSVRHIVILLQHQLLEWLFEFSQNFVNFSQVYLLTKPLFTLGKEAVSDYLHVANLGIKAVHHLVLMEVIVCVLQDGANSCDGKT